jgi:hypothetical protein
VASSLLSALDSFLGPCFTGPFQVAQQVAYQNLPAGTLLTFAALS